MKMQRNTSKSFVFIFGNSQQFVSDVYMEDIVEMKCQLHHIHLDKYFIYSKHDQKRQHLC